MSTTTFLFNLLQHRHTRLIHIDAYQLHTTDTDKALANRCLVDLGWSIVYMQLSNTSGLGLNVELQHTKPV